MKGIIILFLMASFNAIANVAFWDTPDWSMNATLPSIGHRTNIYQAPRKEFHHMIHQGGLHALIYPVDVTGVLISKNSLEKIFTGNPNSPLRNFLLKQGTKMLGFKKLQDMWAWLGVHEYPEQQSLQIPFPNNKKPDFPMGLTLIKKNNIEAITFSCAACHSGNLFGTKVLGMTNRFPRANDFFEMAKKSTNVMPPKVFQFFTQVTNGEKKMYERSRNNLKSAGVRVPQVLGLDTSLAQVGLSLVRRNEDEYATKSSYFEKYPRASLHQNTPADSKPAVWWNLKYKTRWLSDGSVVQGNPVFTNFLWNEIGRGVDLWELEAWLEENQQIIRDLTARVFASEAPRYEDFFPATNINLESAKRGKTLFDKSCAKCHGFYNKAWNEDNAHQMTQNELIQTTKVRYTQTTRVKDVGTSPYRYEGMKDFADKLNSLAISKWMKTIVKPQKGYVPPPLVGIWARWPYFHNNSIPNLCELLKPATKRVKSFWMGKALDKNNDFDQECNGYPLDGKTPTKWKKNKAYFYDTKIKGLSNQGHDENILTKNGKEFFSSRDKKDLIMFLKTL